MVEFISFRSFIFIIIIIFVIKYVIESIIIQREKSRSWFYPLFLLGRQYTIETTLADTLSNLFSPKKVPERV